MSKSDSSAAVADPPVADATASPAEAAPTATADTSAPAATPAEKKARVQHFSQIVIKVHDGVGAPFDLSDLQEVLTGRATDAKAVVKTDVKGNKTTYTIAPMGKLRASAQDRLAAKFAKLQEQAAKAGIDLSTLSAPAVDTGAQTS